MVEGRVGVTIQGSRRVIFAEMEQFCILIVVVLIEIYMGDKTT